MKNLKINFAELSYIMDIPAADAKSIFSQETGDNKIKNDLFLTVECLEQYFKPIKSIDARFDGVGAVGFNMQQNKMNYLNFLSSKPMIKKLSFTGGKTIFYKTLSEKHLIHALESFKRSHVHLFGQASMELELKILNTK